LSKNSSWEILITLNLRWNNIGTQGATALKAVLPTLLTQPTYQQLVLLMLLNPHKRKVPRKPANPQMLAVLFAASCGESFFGQ
jgi:hypothetical protein